LNGLQSKLHEQLVAFNQEHVLAFWDELTDNHASEGETTSFTDLDVPVGTTKLFYRVIRP
jgi:hypothetical protein